jgi:hypothetical protein
LSGAVGKTPPVIDKYGLIYVIDEEMAEVKADPKRAIPLVIRANVYDCVDVLLSSEWDDDDFTNFQMSKVNIHPIFSNLITRPQTVLSRVFLMISP